MSAFDNMNAVLFYKLQNEIGMTDKQIKDFLAGLRLMEREGFKFSIPDAYLMKVQDGEGNIVTDPAIFGEVRGTCFICNDLDVVVAPFGTLSGGNMQAMCCKSCISRVKKMTMA